MCESFIFNSPPPAPSIDLFRQGGVSYLGNADGWVQRATVPRSSPDAGRVPDAAVFALHNALRNQRVWSSNDRDNGADDAVLGDECLQARLRLGRKETVWVLLRTCSLHALHLARLNPPPPF